MKKNSSFKLRSPLNFGQKSSFKMTRPTIKGTPLRQSLSSEIEAYNEKQRQVYNKEQNKYKQELQEWNRKNKRYQNQIKMDQLYQEMKRIDSLGDKYQLLFSTKDDGTTDVINYYEKDNPNEILRISDNPKVMDYMKQRDKIYKKGGLANQYANIRRNQMELYREGDVRHYHKDRVDPKFHERFNPGQKPIEPIEPMYKVPPRTLTSLPVTTGDNQAGLVKYQGPKYFEMDNIDSDLGKQLYVRKDIYGDIPKGIEEGKVVEEEIPGYGNYVRINYDYSKRQGITDSIKNLFKRNKISYDQKYERKDLERLD
tara:strand:+ start:1132 stop:2067 length:936 start_codon:yes stop_codon:yes gene_type:complete